MFIFVKQNARMAKPVFLLKKVFKSKKYGKNLYPKITYNNLKFEKYFDFYQIL
jgi:hypothetical protein